MLASLVPRLDEERLKLHGVLEHLAVSPGKLPGSLENCEDVSLEEVETFVESAVETPLDDVEVERTNAAGCSGGSGRGPGLGGLEMFRQLRKRIGEASLVSILGKKRQEFFNSIMPYALRRQMTADDKPGS